MRFAATVFVGLGPPGAFVASRIRDGVGKVHPIFLDSILVAALLPSGWKFGHELGSNPTPLGPQELLAPLNQGRRDYLDETAAKKDNLAQLFARQFQRYIAFDRNREELLRDSGYDMDATSLRFLISWSGADPFGAAVGPMMLATLRSPLLHLFEGDFSTCVFFDASLGDALAGDAAFEANSTAALADLHNMLIDDPGDEQLKALGVEPDVARPLTSQCYYMDCGTGGSRMAPHEVLDVQAEFVVRLTTAIGPRQHAADVILNSPHHPLARELGTGGGVLDSRVSLLGVHTEALDWQKLKRQGSLRLCEKLCACIVAGTSSSTGAAAADRQLASKLADLTGVGESVGVQVRDRLRQHPSPTPDLEELEDVEEGWLNYQRIVAHFVFDALPKMVAEPTAKAEEEFLNDLRARLAGLLQGEQPLADVESLCSNLERFLTESDKQGPAISTPDILVPLDNLRREIAATPYSQAAYLWIGLMVVSIFYFAIYSKALPMAWGNELLSSALSTLYLMALIILLVVGWLWRSRLRIGAATLKVTEAANGVLTGQAVHLRTRHIQSTKQRIRGELRQWFGPDSLTGLVRTRLDRLAGVSRQERLGLQIGDSLVCSSAVANDEMEAVVDQYLPANVKPLATQFLSRHKLEPLILEADEASWTAFEKAIRVLCNDWTEQRLANESLVHLLMGPKGEGIGAIGIEKIKQRVVANLAKYSTIRCQLAADPNAVMHFAIVCLDSQAERQLADQLLVEVARRANAAADPNKLSNRDGWLVSWMQVCPLVSLGDLPGIAARLLALDESKPEWRVARLSDVEPLKAATLGVPSGPVASAK